jgi:hypothetical protein
MSQDTARLLYSDILPYAVAETLEELQGPTSGVVMLPNSLAWTGRRSFDLSKPADVASMYKVVLHEARGAEDLRRYLNRRLLVEHWDDIGTGRAVRPLWEQRFPQLPREHA